VLESEKREKEWKRRAQESERRELESERRELESERRELESERRTRLIESEIERLAVLESKLDSLLLSADSSSQAPPETDCN